MLYFYRLAIIENGAAVKFSATKTAKLSHDAIDFTILKNPTDGLIDVKLYGYESAVQITVLNSTGQAVFQKNYLPTTKITLDISTHAPGHYWISLQAGNNKIVKKIIKF